MAEHGAHEGGWFSKVTALLGHHGALEAANNFKRYGIEPFVPIFLIIISLSIFILFFDEPALWGMLAALTVLSPFWLPVLLGKFFWITWIEYLRYQFWFSHDMVLLEIQLPAEVEKSPLAMELFLTTLWQTGGETSVLNRIWKGRFRAVWSLEIASNEGKIGFYIHLRRSFKDVVEARLYGQYPEAKITEVEDYARKIPFNTDDYRLWGCEFRKTGPAALPIKTYVDYELNKDTDKPETKVDPMTNMLELFSTAKKDEWFWMQIIVRAHKSNEWFGFFKKADNYKDSAAAEIKALMTKAGARAKELAGADEVFQAQAAARGITLLTGGEKLRVEAIEHSLSKMTFDCGVVVIYISRPHNFNFINIMNTVRLFDPYRGSDGASQYNGINPTRGMAGYDYPWQDYKGILQNRDRRKMFFRYTNRAYFFVPYDQEPIYFSSEELATIWHLPTSTVQTPGLSRVTSSLSEAPRNLPTLPS